MLAAHLISRSDQGAVAGVSAAAIYRRMIAESFQTDAKGLRAHYFGHPSGAVVRAFERSPGRYPETMGISWIAPNATVGWTRAAMLS